MYEPCIYIEGRRHIQTLVADYKHDGVLRCIYSGKTAVSFLAANPRARLMNLNEALGVIEEVQDRELIKDWKEISEESYFDALEVLPPEKWETVQGVEIFRSCEYLTGNITAHYARINGRFFTAMRRTSTPYAKIVQEISKLV